MKVTELRIGNYVQVLGDVEPVLGVSNRLRPDVGYFEFKGFKVPLKGFHLKPIPLTEEWLLKLGFRFEIEDDSFRKNKYAVSISESGCLFFYAHNYSKLIELCEFKHVHQLQNLYFALTGEELTID